MVKEPVKPHAVCEVCGGNHWKTEGTLMIVKGQVTGCVSCVECGAQYQATKIAKMVRS